MEEKFFKFEQLKVGELIEGYFIKSESEITKRVRFLQRRSSQKEDDICGKYEAEDEAIEAWNRRSENA